jgi:two-component system phosphate regulon sensor histidine kinase PhoR
LTGRIFLKLIAGVLCLLALALVTVDYFATDVAQHIYIDNLVHQLTDKGRMLALTLPRDLASLTDLARAAGGRVTIIRADGKVLADSEARPETMENHRTPSRPEVMQALAGRTGWQVRRSATLGIQFLYVGVPGPEGEAFRIAVPLEEIQAQGRAIREKILASTALAFLPAMLLAALAARWISRRFAAIKAHSTQLAHGNFRARLPDTGSSEFGQLAETLNETAAHLQAASEQLEREHAELERVERIRKDFVINVSHELRTPLASIQGYTETLMDGALNDPGHNMRFLGIIRHNAERLARLTQDLLTLSRIEQKREKLEFEFCPVEALLQDALDIVQPIAEKNRIRLETEPGAADLRVWCDPEAVLQVLGNLLDNAVKYTAEGGRIAVGAHPAARFVELYVRDTGIGIPAEDLPRLFERFYRVDKARSRELGGTGLGLSIVKHLVAAHNGAVRVESSPGQGSAFFFTLPVDESALETQTLNPEFTAS